MDTGLLSDLKKNIKGDVSEDSATLQKFSHDASIFELKPQMVVAPEDAGDIENLVDFINGNKDKYPHLSLTARAAGTDMSGGPLSESIVLSFTPHFNKISAISGDTVIVEPGVYYRDFEKLTLASDLLFPAYPVSKDICAIGGIIGNNSGGEKSLEFGKAERYVKKLKMVLSDGKEYEFEALNQDKLKEKLSLHTFEGEIYRKIYRLINDNYEDIKKAKPEVSKNSSGYSLWNVYDKDTKTFDLTQLFVGSQGTLGILTEATLKLVPVRRHSQMLVILMPQKDLGRLAEVINTVLEFKPESFETYDDNTLRLAVKYFPEFGKKLGTSNILGTFFHFLPEIAMVLTGHVPKLVLQAEFTGDSKSDLLQKVRQLAEKLKPFNLKTKLGGNETQSRKYWLIRRESFSLLKNKVKNMHAAPFIDDFVVQPKYLSDFLPKLNKLLAKYPSIISTFAGHIGDGNFHIIPLVRLEEASQREVVKTLEKEVFGLVRQFHGTTSGEHNDGIIRTPYLKEMFGEHIYNFFVETKKIFDPKNIFNPGKKVDLSLGFAMKHVRKNWK